MIDEKVKIPKFRRARIKFKKVVDEDFLYPEIEIIDYDALSLGEISKLPYKIHDEYYWKGCCFYINEDDELVIWEKHRELWESDWDKGGRIVVKKGQRMSPKEYDKIIKLMKKAGERLAKIRDEYYKELKKKKEEWEDGEVKEIII